MKKAMMHLNKAHAALKSGDIQSGRFHIGHALAATRLGGQAEEANPNEQEPDNDEDDTTMSKNWIADAVPPSHKGLLHKKLGVPQGQKIPAKKLQSAANSSSPTLRHEAQFAKNVGGLRKRAHAMNKGK